MSPTSVLAQESPAHRVQVTLGVLLDSAVQEGWVLEALRHALAVPGVRLGTIAVTAARRRQGAAANLHRLVDLVDRRLRCGNDRLFADINVPAALDAPPPLKLPLAANGEEWAVDAAGIEALRGAEADVWLCFCASAPQSPFPSVGRMGVWGLEIGPRVPAGSTWAGATEVGTSCDVTFAQVVDYTHPGRNVLYRACGTTVKNSARRNRLLTLRKAVRFFGRLLRMATRDEGAIALSQVDEPALVPGMSTTSVPTPAAVLKLGWRLTTQVLQNRWRELIWRDQWRIGYYFGEEDSGTASPTAQLRRLVPPADRDWADPFIVQWEGRSFIFFEELPYSAGKAHISAVEVFEDREPGEPRTVISRPYHLSYPYLFTWNGTLYMIPESAGNRTVELYRCDEFPHGWTFDRVLIQDVSAYDATLYRDQKRWWLFVNVAEGGADPSEELNLYWSFSPLGPWMPHRANPVVSDARRARSAGALFTRGGVLYRPSQDCSANYGSAVSVNRVDVLDTETYRETPVGRIDPDRSAGMRCLHTVGAAGRLHVLDYQVRRSRWSLA